MPLIVNGAGNNAASPYGRGAIRTGASITMTWGSAVTLASNSVIFVAGGSTLTLGTSVAGPGQLIKEGAGTLMLTGNTNTLKIKSGVFSRRINAARGQGIMRYFL